MNCESVNMDLLSSIRENLSLAGLTPEQPLAVALSGGADSTALLVALCQLGYKVEAWHCNFELRGVESDADEAACRRLCRTQGVGLSVKHFRTRSYATRRGVSIEMAARQLRYEWFGELAHEHAVAAVCVAHHRDDQVETLLQNLIRGTGLRGLNGMRRVSHRDDGLMVVRPLLDVARMDIEAWLTEQNITWQTDSTNRRPDAAQRNKIRLELLPLMQQINPNIRETLAATASRLAEATALFDDAVARARENVVVTEGNYTTIDIAALRHTAAPATVLYELLSPLGFTGEQTADIMSHLDGEAGHVWHSRSGERLLRDRGKLVTESQFLKCQASKPERPPRPSRSGLRAEDNLPLEGLAEYDGVKILVRRQAVDVSFAIPREATTACFDLERLTLPLTIRRVREGDRFRPFGMSGTRLISDLLTDAKVSLFERERQLVVCSGDEIIWVVGRRVAAGYEISSATRHAMTLHQVGA